MHYRNFFGSSLNLEINHFCIILYIDVFVAYLLIYTNLDILNDKKLQKQTEEDLRDVINKSNTTSIRDIKDVERR